MLLFLDSFWPWPLVITAILVMIVILLIRSALRSSLRTPEDLPIEELQEEVTTFDFTRSRRLGASFRWALRQIERHGGGHARYRVPWFLLFGQQGSRPRDLMRHSDLPTAFDVPNDRGLAESSGLSWSFFDHGVVLDLDGEYLLGADGENADTRGWQTFIGLLSRHRPERPLDGLILTLSCAELLSGPAAIEIKVAQLALRLRELKNELAVNIPVYVLVTTCEQLPEFASFVQATERSPSNIFGWSSPYRTEAAFRDTWVDEAYRQITEDLQLAQIEILGGASADKSLADDVALLPVALDATREALSGYLNGLFRSSAFQRGIVVRGIYFSGSGSSEDPVAEIPRQKTHFLNDLLATKIFPEFGLAKSEVTAWTSRNRWVRAGQAFSIAAAAVLTFGLWRAHTDLAQRAELLEPFFNKIENELRSPESHTQENRAKAEYLLSSIASLDFSRYGSFFIPSSWPFVDNFLKRFNHNLEDVLKKSFDKIIFKAAHFELESRADHLSTSLPPIISSDEENVEMMPSVDSLLSYRAWQQRVADLALLEANIYRYSELASENRGDHSHPYANRDADLAAFGALVEYVFGFQPPASFFVNASLYDKALDAVDTQGIEIANYRLDASDTVTELSARFRDELFQRSPLLLSLQALSQELALSVDTVTPTSPEENIHAWRRLLARLDEIEFILRQPQILWAFGSEPAPDADYVELIQEVAEIEFLEDSIADRIVKDISLHWHRHQEELAASHSRYTGPFLARQDSIPFPRLSEQTLQLRDALRMLLDQSFIVEKSEQWFSLSIPPGERLEWDVSRLEQANTLVTPYREFVADGISLFPVDLQPEIRRMARHQTSARMIDLVRQAQTFPSYQEPATSSERERLLRLEVANLARAGGAMNQLLNNLQDLGAFEAHWDLSALLVLQGENIFRRLENVLAEERLYQAQDDGFSWWQGETPVSHPAFGVRDRASLATYLARQRARIDHLAAQYASPTITAIGLSRGEETAAYKQRAEDWLAIISQLGAYQNQTPGNSLARLENLIALDMAAVSPEDCQTQGLEVGSVDDFFLQRANTLGQDLIARCQNLAGERAAERYGELERLFLQRLSGRFPFAEIGSPSSYPGVEPGDLRAFFALYDAYAPSIRAVPASNINFQGTGKNALAFLDRLQGVRDFFAFFLATPDSQAIPRYDFEVIFRVDKNAEQGGNQIIDWRLQVGEQRLAAPNGTGRWTFGEDDLGLDLRWAQDSPRVPYLAEPARNILVQDRVVTYRYDDPWALLSFMLERRGPTPEPNPQTLAFRISTEPSEQTADQAPVDPVASESPTVVFLRLRLTTPDTKNPQPVLLPPCFPIFAPRLGTETVPDGCVAQAAAQARSLFDESPAAETTESTEAGSEPAEDPAAAATDSTSSEEGEA